MKKKILGIFVCMLFVISAFGGVSHGTIEVKTQENNDVSSTVFHLTNPKDVFDNNLMESKETGMSDFVCDAGAPHYGFVGQIIQFVGIAYGGTFPYEWFWDFGDGSDSNEQITVHTYDDPGVYEVTLSVTDQEENHASDSTTATIYRDDADTQPPIVSIDSPENGSIIPPDVVQLTLTGAASDNVGIVAYGGIHEWDGNSYNTGLYWFPEPRESGLFEWDITLHDGWNRLTLYMYDAGENYGYDAVTVEYNSEGREYFMGLEVEPRGQATLDISDDMHVCNIGDSGDDGVWINLKDMYNAYTCTIENPFDSAGASVTAQFNGMVDEDPFSMGMTLESVSGDDNKYGINGVHLGTSARSIIAFRDEEIVFHTTVDDVTNLGYITVVDPMGDWSFATAVDSTGGRSLALIVDPVGIWSFGEQGVENLQINKIMVIGEGDTGDTTFSDVLMCATGIDEFTMLEQYAYANTQPSKPGIDGPTDGKAGTEYTYMINNTGVKDLYYCIDWGDGSEEEWIGVYSPGEMATAEHTWTEQGTYDVKAKAMDACGSQSDWSTITISMPKSKTYVNGLFLRFLQDHPCMFPILRQLLGL